MLGFPCDTVELIAFEGGQPLTDRLEALKTQANSGIMNSFKPQDKKAFGSEARTLATNAENS